MLFNLLTPVMILVSAVVLYKNSSSIDVIKKVHQAFADIGCKNTVLPDLNLPKWLIPWLETFKFFYEEGMVRIDQKLRKSCVQAHTPGYYIVTYVIDGKTYKLLVKPVRGPPYPWSIFGVVDESKSDKDITQDIDSFIRGNQSITQINANLLGYDFLYVRNEYTGKNFTANGSEIISESFLNSDS